MERESTPEDLPILPLRNTVLFPGVVLPINVGRDQSLKLLKEANKGGHDIGVMTQRDGEVENPASADLHDVGTVARIVKMLRMPDGSNTVIIQGKRRCRMGEVVSEEPYLRAKVTPFPDAPKIGRTPRRRRFSRASREMSMEVIQHSPTSLGSGHRHQEHRLPRFLVHFIAANMNAEKEQKQGFLEVEGLKERVEKVMELLGEELQVLELKNDIQSRVKTDIEKQQREYFLQQQMKQIQEELGSDPHKEDIAGKKARAELKDWPEKVAETFAKEIGKLERMNTQSAEYSVQSNYLDLLLDLPWNITSEDNFDLAHAQEILDEDHYGLEKVKERIIEHLAVLKLKGDMKSPIICLYGPPGVGKTSLGKSIAKALGREYVRMSLGGLRMKRNPGAPRKDIGAMPGRSSNLKKSGPPTLFVWTKSTSSAGTFMGTPPRPCSRSSMNRQRVLPRARL